MIIIQRKEDCCGCGACYDVCAKNAIVWQPDREGFSYPCVDTTRCVDCGLCNKVCPIENSETIVTRNKEFNPIVIGAYHQDEDIRFTSTSGGAFWGLAASWVKQGGYVAGAIFTEHFNVKHIVTDNLDELQKIKGSKYCQSDCRGMYKEVARLLKLGEKVMATGLPCQMAGLRQYLRKDYDNLLVVDLICHSVPSPVVFQKYIEYLENKHHSQVVKYHPKNKELGGWHSFSFKAYFEDGQIYHQNYDSYTSVAFSNIISRYSCFECHFKHYPQASDINIGDFWGIENVDKSFDSPKGLSKIVINTQRGLDFFNSLTCFEMREYDADVAIFKNKRAWPQHTPIKRCDETKRTRFFNSLYKNGFIFAAHQYTCSERTIIHKIMKLFQLYVKDRIK